MDSSFLKILLKGTHTETHSQEHRWAFETAVLTERWKCVILGADPCVSLAWAVFSVRAFLVELVCQALLTQAGPSTVVLETTFIKMQCTQLKVWLSRACCMSRNKFGNMTSQQVSHVDEQKTPDNNSNSWMRMCRRNSWICVQLT